MSDRDAHDGESLRPEVTKRQPRPRRVTPRAPAEEWIEREVAPARDNGLETRLAVRVERLIGEFERRGKQIEAGIDARLEELAGTLSAMQQLARREMPRRMREFDRQLSSAEQTIDRLRDGGDQLLGRMSEASASAEQVERRIEASLANLTAALADLAEHRSSLAGSLSEDRQALLDDVIGRIVEQLSPRNRRRIAARLVEAESSHTRRSMSDPTVQPSRTSSTGTAPTDAGDGREDLLTRLAEVRGVGSVRARLLADAFTDVEALASADEDKVIERTGLPAHVARATLTHLRR